MEHDVVLSRFKLFEWNWHGNNAIYYGRIRNKM